MSYEYSVEKKKLFTDEGQRMFLAIRDNTFDLLEKAGAVMMAQAIAAAPSGEVWTMLACVDRLVELGEIRELPTSGAGQYRVFVRKKG